LCTTQQFDSNAFWRYTTQTLTNAVEWQKGNMYSVALHTNTQAKTFAMTVRDFARSKHWTTDSKDYPYVYFDERDALYKGFAVLAEFATETEARKFAAVLEGAYALAGYSRETVKVTFSNASREELRIYS
jgi:hypothetical protein